jgi:hypothetical protein
LTDSAPDASAGPIARAYLAHGGDKPPNRLRLKTWFPRVPVMAHEGTISNSTRCESSGHQEVGSMLLETGNADGDPFVYYQA